MCFEVISGLSINFNKSSIYGIGVNLDLLNECTLVLGCNLIVLPFQYLGHPGVGYVIGRTIQNGQRDRNTQHHCSGEVSHVCDLVMCSHSPLTLLYTWIIY